MVSLYATFLLGHLVADFPLQTNRIFQWKNRGWVGIMVHSVIHGVVTALLLEDALKYWLLLMALSLIHFGIDWVKLRVQFEWQAVGFLLDQAVHLLSLFFISLWAKAWGVGILIPPEWVRVAVGYGVLPVLLMFFFVLFSDLYQCTTVKMKPAWERILVFRTLSQIAGVPLAIVPFIVRFGGRM